MQIAKHFPLNFEVQQQLQINKTRIERQAPACLLRCSGPVERCLAIARTKWQISSRAVQNTFLVRTSKLRCKKSNEFKDRMQTLSWPRPHEECIELHPSLPVGEPHNLSIKKWPMHLVVNCFSLHTFCFIFFALLAISKNRKKPTNFVGQLKHCSQQGS